MYLSIELQSCQSVLINLLTYLLTNRQVAQLYRGRTQATPIRRNFKTVTIITLI